MARFSARHYRSVSPPADTSADITDRIKRNAAAAQAMKERQERYPVLTSDNAQDAIDFQEARYRELYEQTRNN